MADEPFYDQKPTPIAEKVDKETEDNEPKAAAPKRHRPYRRPPITLAEINSKHSSLMLRLASLPSELQIQILNYVFVRDCKTLTKRRLRIATNELFKPWLLCPRTLHPQFLVAWWESNTFIVPAHEILDSKFFDPGCIGTSVGLAQCTRYDSSKYEFLGVPRAQFPPVYARPLIRSLHVVIRYVKDSSLNEQVLEDLLRVLREEWTGVRRIWVSFEADRRPGTIERACADRGSYLLPGVKFHTFKKTTK